jgi:hydrogenase expression/formation protein HypE
MAYQTGNDVVLLAHGDGGLLTHRLLEKYFLPCFDNKLLHQLTDAASFPVEPGHMAITTDAFVVDPIFFPGGDIGKLAVCGTVNDLAVSGAKPLYLAATFIIEEGFLFASLEHIVASMAGTCAEAGVAIIAGDTKVVGRGQADKIYITTTGVGYILPEARLGYGRIEPGDRVIVNGPLGNHGLSILLERGSFDMVADVVSDCAPLNGITERLIREFPSVKFMRDLTRGGFATNAKEIALQAMVDLRLDEKSIPVDDSVKGVTEILGLDPLYLANEGKFLAIISEKEADRAVDLLQNEPFCTKPSIIGTIGAGRGDVFLKTELGGTRKLNMLAGAPLPRIC